jgi:hypothetical protein
LQDPTQVVDSCGVERLVSAEFVNGGAGNMVIFNKGIG